MSNLMNLRDRHFMDACREIIKNLDPTMEINMREVAQRAAMSPAPHYYCTFEYALRMIRVLRHGRLKLRNVERAEFKSRRAYEASGLYPDRGSFPYPRLGAGIPVLHHSRYGVKACLPVEIPTCFYNLKQSLL